MERICWIKVICWSLGLLSLGRTVDCQFGQRTTTRSPNRFSWLASNFPDPQVNIYSCGWSGHVSRLCDPNRVMSRNGMETADKILKTTQDSKKGACGTSTGCKVAVAVVPSIQSTSGGLSSRNEADIFARDLRYKWGADILYAVSRDSRTIGVSQSDSSKNGISPASVQTLVDEEIRKMQAGQSIDQTVIGLLTNMRDTVSGAIENYESYRVFIFVWAFLLGGLGLIMLIALIVSCCRARQGQKEIIKEAENGESEVSASTADDDDDDDDQGCCPCCICCGPQPKDTAKDEKVIDKLFVFIDKLVAEPVNKKEAAKKPVIIPQWATPEDDKPAKQPQEAAPAPRKPDKQPEVEPPKEPVVEPPKEPVVFPLRPEPVPPKEPVVVLREPVVTPVAPVVAPVAPPPAPVVAPEPAPLAYPVAPQPKEPEVAPRAPLLQPIVVPEPRWVPQIIEGAPPASKTPNSAFLPPSDMPIGQRSVLVINVPGTDGDGRPAVRSTMPSSSGDRPIVVNMPDVSQPPRVLEDPRPPWSPAPYGHVTTVPVSPPANQTQEPPRQPVKKSSPKRERQKKGPVRPTVIPVSSSPGGIYKNHAETNAPKGPQQIPPTLIPVGAPNTQQPPANAPVPTAATPNELPPQDNPAFEASEPSESDDSEPEESQPAPNTNEELEPSDKESGTESESGDPEEEEEDEDETNSEEETEPEEESEGVGEESQPDEAARDLKPASVTTYPPGAVPNDGTFTLGQATKWSPRGGFRADSHDIDYF